MEFLVNRRITFCGVDIRRDERVLAADWVHIPPGYHIDIQDIYNIKGGAKHGRAGMAAMAGELIDEKFFKMKDGMQGNMAERIGHSYWEWKPLSKKNLTYAILDGYVTYELYRVISSVNKGQAHLENVAAHLPRPIQWRLQSTEQFNSGRSYNPNKRKNGWENSD